MADRFYTPDAIALGEFALAGAEAHHLTAVRRFAPGDAVTLFNGDGAEYRAEVLAAGKKQVVLTVLERLEADRERPAPLTVAAALPKGDRADFLVEKLVELGVARFIPLTTTRSVVVPKAASVEKFARAVIEASKQCGRNRLMAVEPPRSWAQLLVLGDLPPTRFVLHTDPTGAIGLPSLGPDVPAVVAVGPEGGLTAEEVAAAVRAGWHAATLGPRVLRVETAAIAAAARLG